MLLTGRFVTAADALRMGLMWGTMDEVRMTRPSFGLEKLC
jgi:hypothetical protein